MAADEALGLHRHVVGLVSDALEIIGGRAVAGELVDAAEQRRHIIEFGRGAPLDVRNHVRPPDRRWGCRNQQELNLEGACIAHSTLPLLPQLPVAPVGEMTGLERYSSKKRTVK